MTGITSVSPHQVVLQGTQDLWTFYADAAVAFEKSMSLLRGVYIDESQMEHDGKLHAYLLSEGSCSLACFCKQSIRLHLRDWLYMGAE